MRRRNSHGWILAVLVCLMAFQSAWADKLYGGKRIHVYPFGKLRETAARLLHEETDVVEVFSSSAGDALFFVGVAQVAVVPLDPRDEVRVYPLSLPPIADRLRRMENRLLARGKGSPASSTEECEGGIRGACVYKDGVLVLSGGAEIEEDDAYERVAPLCEYHPGGGREAHTAGDRLYTFSSRYRDCPPQTMMCTVFQQKGESYVKQEEFEIKSPSSPHDGVMWIEDFDPVGGYVLFADHWDLPSSMFKNKKRVFDLEKRAFVETKRFAWGTGFFLQGDVLARFEHSKEEEARGK